jgi:hypothetical protein
MRRNCRSASSMPARDRFELAQRLTHQEPSPVCFPDRVNHFLPELHGPRHLTVVELGDGRDTEPAPQPQQPALLISLKTFSSRTGSIIRMEQGPGGGAVLGRPC